MFCSSCGAEIIPGAVVCLNCGVPVNGKSIASATEQVPNHLVGAILTTIFCCQIGGIIAIIYAAQVNTKLACGDVDGARAASKTANTWIMVNIITGVLIGIIYFIAGMAGA